MRIEEADSVDADIPGAGETQERISEEAGGVVDEARAETTGAVGALLGALSRAMVAAAAAGFAVGIPIGLAIGRRRGAR